MPSGCIYVGRPMLYGNPFPIDVYGAEKAVDLYDRWLNGPMSMDELSKLSRCDRWGGEVDVPLMAVRRWLLDALPALRGHDLCCWCALDRPCHADVLLKLANA
jgi:hypothetical protein